MGELYTVTHCEKLKTLSLTTASSSDMQRMTNDNKKCSIYSTDFILKCRVCQIMLL